jgi:sugar phosphate permease
MTLKPGTLESWRGQIYLAAWTLYAGYYFCRKDMGEAVGGSHFAVSLACFGLTYAVGQIVGGALADQYGPRRTALAGAAISIFCTLLLTWFSQPAPELLLQLGNGLGQGFGWPSLLKLIGAFFGRDERDRVLGWWSSSYILCGLLATSMTAWLVVHTGFAVHSGFQSAYLVSSAILLCATVFFYAITWRVPDPLSASNPELSTGRWVMRTNAAAQVHGWKVLLRNRSIQIISGMYFFLKMTRYTLLFWLPHYLISSFAYSVHQAEHTASYFELCGFLGPIAVGYATQRLFRNRRMALGATMLFTLAFVCLLHPVLAESGWFGMVVSISLMGILIHGADLLMSGMAVLDAVPEQLHGRAVGLVNGFGSIGMVISPLLATIFVARLGWNQLFDLFVFFALAGGSICAVGAQLRPPSAPPLNRSVLVTEQQPI